MQVTVFKCSETGALFEDEGEYKAHKRELKRQAERAARRAAVQAELAALVEKAAALRTVNELLELVQEIGFKQAELNGNSEFKGLRLQEVSVAGRQTTSLQARVLVFSSGRDSFFSSTSFERIAGFRMSSGSGATLPSDAPAGATRCMNYQASIELDKLPGLKQTRDDILAGRQGIRDLRERLRTQADETLYSESQSFRELQEEAATLETEIETLQARLTSYNRRKTETLHKIAQAVKEKQEELEAANPEPFTAQATLETQMKVGSV